MGRCMQAAWCDCRRAEPLAPRSSQPPSPPHTRTHRSPASSSTKNLTWSQASLPRSMRSITRPGVPTTTSTPACRLRSCGAGATPPTSSTLRSDGSERYLRKSLTLSYVCSARSLRVGRQAGRQAGGRAGSSKAIGQVPGGQQAGGRGQAAQKGAAAQRQPAGWTAEGMRGGAARRSCTAELPSCHPPGRLQNDG